MKWFTYANPFVGRAKQSNRSIRGMVVMTSKKKVTKLIERLHPCEFDLIRLGPNEDGGYLVPDDLDGIEACFSPGVDLMSEFELECIDRRMKVFMADNSIDKPNLSISVDAYNFQKKFIGCTNNEKFMTMDSWVKSSCLPHESELLLQMDIEGGEYDSIINMSDSLISRFRIMVIEFHNLKFLRQSHFFRFAHIVFEKILQTHLCVHIHPNNCDHINITSGVAIPNVAEFTFIRKDRVKSKRYQTQFPHKLDFDNDRKHRTVMLPKNWYNSREA